MATSRQLARLVGGFLGVAAHHVVAPAMMRAARADVLDVVVDVYRAPVLVLAAARTTIEEVLHDE
ncbi:hypothetical protein [Saccharothrix xinjiangensis]